MAKHPEESELREDRFASQFREIGGAHESRSTLKMRCRGEDQLREMGDEARVERESISNEDQLQRKEDAVIRPKRRAEACSLGKKWIWAEMLFCKHDEIKYRGIARSKSGVTR